MTNLEKYKDEIFKKISCPAEDDGIDCLIQRVRNKTYNCYEHSCYECQISSFKWLCEEYKELKIKLTKLEYDLLKAVHGELYFDDYEFISHLHDKGHFQGLKDTSMKISDILANCEVVDDEK